MPLDPRDRRNFPGRKLPGGRQFRDQVNDPRMRGLVDAKSHGRTRRPRGTGGNGVHNAELGQWAQARFFGYFVSQIPPIDSSPRTENLLNDAGVSCERSQYVVSVSAIETSDADPFVGNPILTRQQVENQGQPLSQLQMEILWSLGAGKDNRLLVDIGAGFQMSLPATRVQCGLIVPGTAFNLDGREGQPTPAGPLDPITGAATAFNQALVWATVNRTGTYSSFAEWQLTRGFFVPTNATLTLPIPQGADFVEVFEISAPAAPTTFLNFVTLPAPAPLDVGQLSFLTNRPRSTGRVRIPGTAAAIQSGTPNALSNRFFSVIFTMRP